MSQPIRLNHQSAFPQLSILLLSFPLDCREEKQQLLSVQFSILCLPASCQSLAWFAEPPVFEVLQLFFFSFWHFKCGRGPPRLRTKLVRQRGQRRVSDAIAEHNCHHQPRVTAGCAGGAAAAAAEPRIPGGSGSSWWCWGSLGAGVTPGQGYKQELSPEESTWQLQLMLWSELKPVHAAGRVHGALGVVAEEG